MNRTVKTCTRSASVTSRSTAILVALVSISATTCLPTTTFAQDRLDIEKVADSVFPVSEPEVAVEDMSAEQQQRAGIFVDNNEFDVVANIDNWVFSPYGGDGNSGRERLASQAKLQVELAKQVCVLRDDQVEKLRLAGLGDITLFFAQIEELKDDFRGKVDQQRINEVYQRTQPLQQRLNEGLCGRDSITYKVAARVLDEEQFDRFQQAHQARKLAAFRATVKATVGQMEKLAPMTAKQRKALVELICDTDDPAVAGNYAAYYVLYQLSRKREEVGKILSESTMKALAQPMAQGAAMQQFLKQQGIIR